MAFCFLGQEPCPVVPVGNTLVKACALCWAFITEHKFFHQKLDFKHLAPQKRLTQTPWPLTSTGALASQGSGPDRLTDIPQENKHQPQWESPIWGCWHATLGSTEGLVAVNLQHWLKTTAENQVRGRAGVSSGGTWGWLWRVVLSHQGQPSTWPCTLPALEESVQS